jgi:hypothetical protein
MIYTPSNVPWTLRGKTMIILLKTSVFKSRESQRINRILYLRTSCLSALLSFILPNPAGRSRLYTVANVRCSSRATTYYPGRYPARNRGRSSESELNQSVSQSVVTEKLVQCRFRRRFCDVLFEKQAPTQQHHSFIFWCFQP